MEIKDKCKKSIQEKNIAILKSDFTLPLPKLDQVASTKPPLKGFTRATRNLVKEDSLLVRRIEEGFNPKAYKLLVKSGYDFQNPPQLGQATVDELKELNLGIDEEPRLIYVSLLLTPEEESKYFELLMEYKDVFAWTYKEMSGLDPTVVVHWLAIK